MINWLVLFAILILNFTAAVIGSIATRSTVDTWYRTLKKPAWNPPDWLFGPVWTVLYISMGVAMWLVWLTEPESNLPFILYGVQLTLNALWSVFFFAMKRPGLALVDIVALWITLAATTIDFSLRVSAAGKLMLPYLLWVTFAAALNHRIWVLNQDE